MAKIGCIIFNVGINDVDYPISKTSIIDGKVHYWTDPYYRRWYNILNRCYNPKAKSTFPTYQDCYISEEWRRFSRFKSWMESQDWEDKFLDKDLLVRGNKEYCKEKCVFVSREINNFLTERGKSRGLWPIGVSVDRYTGKFKARCKNPETGKSTYLGLFTSPEGAHSAWLEAKVEYAAYLANKQTDIRVREALLRWHENYDEI